MKKTNKTKFAFGEAVEVIWRDTSGGAAWQSLHEELPEPPHVEQLGYFLKAENDTLYLCQGIPNREKEECMVLGASAIPMGCILSVRRVK